MNAEVLGLTPDGDIAAPGSVSTRPSGYVASRVGRVSPFSLSLGRINGPLSADGAASLTVESVPAMPKVAAQSGSREGRNGAKLTQAVSEEEVEVGPSGQRVGDRKGDALPGAVFLLHHDARADGLLQDGGGVCEGEKLAHATEGKPEGFSRPRNALVLARLARSCNHHCLLERSPVVPLEVLDGAELELDAPELRADASCDLLAKVSRT